MNFRFHPLFVSLLLVPTLAAAQMHHVDKPEQVTRAVGVYEWTGELDKPKASRLVPVSLFINGQMRDAGIYLARPVPFALETGNVYAIEFAGQPKGTVDLKLARNLATQETSADNPEGSWYGYGPFAPPGVAKKSTLKPTVNLAAIIGSDDDSRPHFVAPRAEAPATPAPKTGPRTPVNDDDSEHPTLQHRDDNVDENGKEKKQKKEKPGGYVTAAGAPLGDDPDRPVLRVGKAASDDTPPLDGLPADMHQAIAVSDPASEDPHDFARAWDTPTERAETLAALEKSAQAAVAVYMKANALDAARASADDSAAAAMPAATTPSAMPDSSGNPPVLRRTSQGVATRTVPPPPSSSTTGKKTKSAKSKVAAPAIPITLTHEDLRSYNLTYGGLPTFVYTAVVPATPVAAATAAVHVSVALVAQRMPTGELQIALHSVTDSGHLNRAPELRFVDVVDPDGSHRASMLFEQRFAHSRQFALYRLVSANAEQTFTTGPIF